jgi:Uma2 family endonuclease
MASLPEQRMLVQGASWKDYVILREVLDTPGLRMTYCEGVLELMSPSREHELWKTTIARLVELHAFLTVYDGFGIPEVWLWRDGAFELYRRGEAGGYERIDRSAHLPELDFALVARFAVREDQDVALREFALAAGGDSAG